MRRSVVVLIATTLLIAASSADEPPAQPPADDCYDGNCTIVDSVLTTTYELVPYVGANIVNGKVRNIDCDPVNQVVVDRIVTRTTGSNSVRYYSGSYCLDEAPDGGTLDTPRIMEAVNLPSIQVDHNPHAEFFLPNLDTWFWHSGPTDHVQEGVTIKLDALTTLVGTYRGVIHSYCWTVDDPRPAPLLKEVGGPACDGPPEATTLISTKPGRDNKTSAAAHHIFDTAGYSTTITHEVVWTGTFEITTGPGFVNGQTLTLEPTIVRAQTTVPIRQLYPYPVPNPS